MTNVINNYEKEQIEKLTAKKRIPAFRAGDTIKVSLKIIEGERSRLQAFEGICIARKNNGLNSSFTIRKLSHGEGVERVFPLFNPLIDKIEVVRKGDVRRAKLYYLRDRKGKRARIVDSNRGEEADQYSPIEVKESETQENQQDIKESAKEETDKTKNNETEAEKEVNKKSSDKIVEELVAEDKKSTEEKSESTASKAEKTEDESKS